MKKFFILISNSILATLFLFLAVPAVLAAEGECHAEPCFVPAPTLLAPGQGVTVTTTRPAIRGLTWKAAIARIYLDGQELKNVVQKEHQDFYSGLFVIPDFDLAPGPHVLYAMAHSEKPGWGDESVESKYLHFIVATSGPKAKAVKPAESVKPVATSTIQLSPKAESTEATATASLPTLKEENTATGQVQVLTEPATGQVEIKEQGEIGGGVTVSEEEFKTATNSLQTAAGLSDLGEILKDEFKEEKPAGKARSNRLIGLIMLAIIVIIGLVRLVTKRERQLKEMLLKEREQKLPFDSASTPLGLAQGMPPIDFEVMPENQKDSDRYQISPAWGSSEKIPSPPASPSSPYPSSVDENKDQERLGL